MSLIQKLPPVSKIRKMLVISPFQQSNPDFLPALLSHFI
jgi:hypothetical protein